MSTNRFLSSESTGNLTGGTTTIYGATIGADNLFASRALRTDSLKRLVSADLLISDVSGLQTAIDAAGIFDRVVNEIKPKIANGVLSIDTIKEESIGAGTTINFIKLNAGHIEFIDIVGPAFPGAGEGKLYKKNGDSGLYWHPDTGPEVNLTDTGGAAVFERTGDIITAVDPNSNLTIPQISLEGGNPDGLKLPTGCIISNSASGGGAAQLVIRNFSPNTGQATILIRARSSALVNIDRLATTNRAVVQFFNNASIRWSFGMHGASTNNAGLNKDLSTKIVEYNYDTLSIKMPTVAINTLVSNDVSLSIDTTTGELGLASSILSSKINISTLSSSDVSFIYQLDTKKFNYRNKDNINGGYLDTYNDTQQYGCIAEDVCLINDDLCVYKYVTKHINSCICIHSNKSECACVDEDDKPINCTCPIERELLSISYNKMIAPMIKCIQDQKVMIDSMLLRIAMLEVNHI